MGNNDKNENIDDFEIDPDYNIEYEHKEHYAKFGKYFENNQKQIQNDILLKKSAPNEAGAAGGDDKLILKGNLEKNVIPNTPSSS